MANQRLSTWFGLSYVSFLTLPRAFMEDMPNEWQEQMAKLLEEYSDTFCNQPDIQTLVMCKQNNRFIKTPEYLKNYRRPDKQKLESFKERDSYNV